MAVGARGNDVRFQFLVESVMISLAGGVIGILLGFVSATLVGRMTGWSMRTSPEAVLVAVLFSAAVGIFFGFYPARKAASLNPIQALRYE
jgi:putative ABC transport system permease protein